MDARTTTWSSEELLDQTEWIRRLARRLVADAARADDLVQDTLLAALERRPRGDGSLRPWLAVVLRRRLALWLRADGRRRAREESRARSEALPSSAELLERAEAKAAVLRATAALREPYRSVILLRYHEGLEPSEIARRGGLPAATVRSQLKRGLDELRVELDRAHGGERRRWVQALLPLAIDAPRPAGTLGPLALVAALTLATSLAIWFLVSPRGVEAVESLLPGGGSSSMSGNLPAAPASAPPGREELAQDPNAPASPQQALQDGRGPFAGMLYEQTTNAPLPHYALRVEDEAGEKELLWTDAEGHFQCAHEHAAGALTLEYLDHPELIGFLRHTGSVVPVSHGLSTDLDFDPALGEDALWSHVGPTYRLTLSAPFAWDSRELVGSLRAADGARYEPRPTLWTVHAPVRRPAGPWIRFQPLYHSLPLDRLWWLAIESDDGLWGGEALVDPGEGVYPQAVEIGLVTRAALEVEVVGAPGLPEPAVTLEAALDGERRALFGRGSRARDDGRASWLMELRAIPPGTYRVLVRAGGEERLADVLALPAGEWTRRVLEVGAVTELARVGGELRSASGSFDEPMEVQLAGSGTSFSERPRWIERDGRLVAPFAFENLPPGEYTLRLVSDRSHRRWHPPELRVSPPQDGVLLTCDDATPARDLLVRVGHPKSLSANALLKVAGSPNPRTSTVAGSRTLHVFTHPAVPIDAALVWYAWAEGCAPRWGDESAVVEAGDHALIEVALEPGWGGRIHAFDEGGAPLADVEIRLDGILAATTDAAGLAYLAAASPPTNVEFGAQARHFMRGEYDPAERRLTGELGMHTLWFGR